MHGATFSTRPNQPKCWSEISQIIGDNRDISIERIQAGRIVRKYDFKEWGVCGRAGCHQQHGLGYIVALLGGGFINIGHCCAAKYSDSERWDRMLSEFDATTTREVHELAIAQALNVAQLKQHWLDTTARAELEVAIALHASFRDQAGPKFLQEIETRAERGRSTVEIERRLTPDEHEARCIALQRLDKPTVNVPWTETARLGEIKGLNCFRPGRAPADARLKLQRLVTVLLTWVRRVGDGEDTKLLQQHTRELVPMTRDLEDSLRATREFFSQTNLDTLMKLPLTRFQGILAIERVGTQEIRISRRPGWNRKCAA